MKAITVPILSLLSMVAFRTAQCEAQESGSAARGETKEAAGNQSAIIDAWRIEMAYVKANHAHEANGMLVGTADGAAGNIELTEGLSKIENDAFTCTLAFP